MYTASSNRPMTPMPASCLCLLMIWGARERVALYNGEILLLDAYWLMHAHGAEHTHMHGVVSLYPLRSLCDFQWFHFLLQALFSLGQILTLLRS